MDLSSFLRLLLVDEHELQGKRFLMCFYIECSLLQNFYMLFMTMILKLYFARKFSGECRKCRLLDPIPDLLIQISGVEAKNVYYTQVSQAIFRQSVVQTTLSN